MNKTYKDTDLREALHRKYADTPQLPADFMVKMEQRMDAKPVAKTRRLWPWVAVAASFLLIIGVGMTLVPTGQPPQSEPQIAQKVELQSKAEQPSNNNMASYDEQQAELLTEKSRVADPSRRTERPKVNHGDGSLDPSSGDCDQENRPHDSDQLDDPNLHYASHDLSKDTVPYQDPARVDDFIAQLADYHQVKQGLLKCSQPVGDNVVNTVYVFPDKDDINLFGRLLQVACWYDSKTPGYHLNFSQQQFFFELKDLRRQLQYRWIAERINGRILFYGTHAPLGTKESSACYQQYRDELMYQNSINIKTKKI